MIHTIPWLETVRLTNGRCRVVEFASIRPLVAPSVQCPSRQICVARRRSNASQTLYRCQTKCRCGRCAIWGGSGHGRPANPSIEGGGGRFTSIPATVDVRLKPRAGLRQNPCNCAWVIVRSMRSCKGLIEYPPLVFEMITTRLVPEVTLFDRL
jgi:hypothetical protein